MVLLLPHDALHGLLTVLADGVLHALLQKLSLTFLLEGLGHLLVGLTALLLDLHLAREFNILHLLLNFFSLLFLLFGLLPESDRHLFLLQFELAEALVR